MPDQDPAAETGGDSQTRHIPASETDRFEFVSTVILALAAIAISWAGFQSAKWSGVQATSFSQAGAARTESVRASSRAGQQVQIDVTTFFVWMEAVLDDLENERIPPVDRASEYEPTVGTLSGFTYQRMREEFRPAMAAWLETDPFLSTEGATTPFAMPEYRLEQNELAEELEDTADQRADDAGVANQRSDNYVVTAVLFATALFFAALSGKLRRNSYRIASLGLGIVLFLGTLVLVLSMPIEM